MLQPGGLGRECRGGSETAGCGWPAAAGGGHWLLVGSEPLPVAVIGSGVGHAGPGWFKSDHPGSRVGQAEGHWFICGSAYEPGLRVHLPEIG